MNITVYLGANEGNDQALKQAVQELGRWIGESGNALVYGGSRCGLMGEIAESTLNAGGEVTGVEPEFFVQGELQHEGLTELIVTKDMTERKTKMKYWLRFALRMGSTSASCPACTVTNTRSYTSSGASTSVVCIRSTVVFRWSMWRMVRPFWSMTAFHSPRASRVTTFFLFCARLWAN